MKLQSVESTIADSFTLHDKPVHIVDIPCMTATRLCCMPREGCLYVTAANHCPPRAGRHVRALPA